MGTSEKLDQMLQNVPEVYHSGQLEVVKNAECLKGLESGNSMLLTDVSPIEHTMQVTVRKKNLWCDDYDKYTHNTYNVYPISLPKGDYYVSIEKFGNIPNVDVTVAIARSGDDYPFHGWYLIKRDDGALFPTKITVDDTWTSPKLAIFATKTNWEKFFANYHLQLEYGTTATAYTPYVPDLTEVKVGRLGSNIFDGNLIGGIYNSTDLDNPDTSSSYVKKYQCIKIYLKAGTYTLSSSVVIRIIRTVIDGVNKTVSLIGTSYTFSVTTDGYHGLSFRREDSADWDSAETVWINMGSTAISYEPYTSEEYSPNSDGTVDNVTSIYPNTTLMTDTEGVLIDCNYYKDINKTFDKLTTSVALSGGDS